MVEQMTLLNWGTTHNEEAILNSLKQFKKRKMHLGKEKLVFDYIFFGSSNKKNIIAQAFVKNKDTKREIFTILIKNTKDMKVLEVELKKYE